MDSKKTSVSGREPADANFWVRQTSRETLTGGSTIAPPWGQESQPVQQRVGIRKAIPCNLLVKTSSAYVLARKIHNISLVGAYVEMDTAGLVPGEMVDIVIDFSYGNRLVEHQFTAEITRVEAQGVGLKFNDYGNRTYTDLINLLYAS